MRLNNSKPPIGVVPRCIHEERRLCALCDIIALYMRHGESILPEWVEEYNDLIEAKKAREEEDA